LRTIPLGRPGIGASALEERVDIGHLETKTARKAVVRKLPVRDEPVNGGTGYEQQLGDIVHGQQVIGRPDRAHFSLRHIAVDRL
jgi:hypothetical protein